MERSLPVPHSLGVPSLACVAAVAFLLIACGGGGEDPKPVRLSLAEHLPVASTGHRIFDAEALGADLGAGLLRQAPGDVFTYHFALPERAVLRGLARASRTCAGSSISIRVLPPDGDERVVFSSAFDRGLVSGRRFAVDLDTSREPMIGLRLSVEATATPAECPTVEWHDVRIEGGPAEPPAQPDLARDRYNVLLVLFDTLRADHTQPYGTQVETPHIAALAARGTTFLEAYSNASWTAPSVTSLLTSLYPSAHGVEGSPALHEEQRSVTRLHPSLPYLPEILREQGYATLGTFGNSMFSPDFGYGRGFDRVFAYARDAAYFETFATPDARADHLWDEAIAPFLGETTERPFFVFVHELDPHSPYEPPPLFCERYCAGEKGDLDPFTIFQQQNERRAPLEPEQLEYLASRYDGEVAAMDRFLGRLLERLAERPGAERTLVVFTSDHGEGFAEHGSLGHGDSLFDELLRVPLVFSLPGVVAADHRVRGPVELVDVPPTILDLLGVKPPSVAQGRSRLAELAGWETPVVATPVFARSQLYRMYSRDSVRLGRWKLIRRNRSDSHRRRRTHELYDLERDPDERENRWADEPIVGATLSQLLRWRRHVDESLRPETTVIRIQDLPPSTREGLRALGYLPAE